MGLNVNKKRKAFWLKQLHQWHWVSSALCLISLLLFSITGITLNHANDIPADPVTRPLEGQLPASLLIVLNQRQSGPLPAPVQQWLDQEFALDSTGKEAEWAPDEVYVALPRPGDASLNLRNCSATALAADAFNPLLIVVSSLLSLLCEKVKLNFQQSF